MTKHSPTPLAEAYQAALRLHLSERTRHRPTSRAARSLGQEAFESDMNTLDLVRMHDLAMSAISDKAPANDAGQPNQISPGGVFLLESLTTLKKLVLGAQQTVGHAEQLGQGKKQELAKNSACYKKLLAESQRLQKQSQRLAHQILIAQEEERREISRELHDEVAQILAGINVRLSGLKAVGIINHESLENNILESQKMIEESVKLVHDFARRLRPAMLDDLGLIPALKSFIKELPKHGNLEIRFTPTQEVELMGNLRRTVFYRVAQEALRNVIRHAEARSVSIDLKVIKDRICLEVHDDGKGFQVKQMLDSNEHQRLGLLGMKERVEMVGGEFMIESSAEKGTTLYADIPFSNTPGQEPK